jgi:hypothetical protein
MLSKIAEKIIRQAMEEGVFDDLEGKGRSLDLQQLDPNTPREWQMAFTILKNASLSPRWIELDKEIRSELDEARQDLRTALKTSNDESERKDRAIQRFKERLNQLNEFLKELNLLVPDANFQRMLLNAEEEIVRIASSAGSDEDESV